VNRIVRLVLLLGLAAGRAAAGPADPPWAAYPQGNGRASAYAVCSACHSFALVAQQGMSRDRWDETLQWMTERQGMTELPKNLRAVILEYLSGAFPEPPARRPAGAIGATLESMPAHAGRNETFTYCSACHSIRLVAQQGQDREGWEEILDWMQEEQGMTGLPPPVRERVLAYLSWAFPADRRNVP